MARRDRTFTVYITNEEIGDVEEMDVSASSHVAAELVAERHIAEEFEQDGWFVLKGKTEEVIDE